MHIRHFYSVVTVYDYRHKVTQNNPNTNHLKAIEQKLGQVSSLIEYQSIIKPPRLQIIRQKNSQTKATI